MKNRLTPVQVGIRIGVLAGLAFAVVVLAVGVNRIGDGSGALADVISAFLVGGVVFGSLAAFAQTWRLHTRGGETAPPGWYDAPTEDGTQWYWSGSRWTDRTRPKPERIRHIENQPW